MPSVIPCPSCQEDVSVQAIQCEKCGESLNEVPDCVKVSVIEDLRDDDLPGYLFQYAIAYLDQNGCYKIGGPPDREILAKLPRGIRVGYTLNLLNGEVSNGGFYQWFTNSSGQITHETLDDLRLIGASDHVRVVGEAMTLIECLEVKYPRFKNRWDDTRETCVWDKSLDAFWEEVNSEYRPAFDSLSEEFYTLEDTNSMWPLFVKYVRQHVNELAHQRG